MAVTLAETMAESGHYNIGSSSVHAHVSAAGAKGGFIDEVLAARGAGSPVKFSVSVISVAGPIAFHFTPDEAAEGKAYNELIDIPE